MKTFLNLRLQKVLYKYKKEHGIFSRYPDLKHLIDQLDGPEIQFAGGRGNQPDFIIDPKTLKAVCIDDFEDDDRSAILDLIDDNKRLDVFFRQADRENLTDNLLDIF